jgi:hypothetical protein
MRGSMYNTVQHYEALVNIQNRRALRHTDAPTRKTSREIVDLSHLKTIVPPAGNVHVTPQEH